MSDPIPPDLDDPDTDPGTAFDLELGRRPPSAMTQELVRLDPTRPGLPWGGLILLGLYLTLCISGIWTAHIRSDAYALDAKMREAVGLLGDEEGRDRETPELAAVARICLSALLINADFLPAHDCLEKVRWRYQERNEAFPAELAHQQAAVSKKSTLARTPTGLFAAMPVNAEKRFSLKALRAKMVTRFVWTGVGAIAILGWILISHQRTRREHLARLRKARDTDRGTALY